MRARRAVILALAAVAGLVIWLVLAIGDREERDVFLYEGEEAPAVASESDEEDQLEPALDLEVEEVETARTVEPVDEVAPSASASTAIPLPSPDSAPVHGLLRDAGTSEALPSYSLRIKDSTGRWEDVLTDEGGRFASGSPMAGGTLEITPFDAPDHRRSLPVMAVARRVEGGEAADLDLTVPCGPTYRLAIFPPDAVVPTTLFASLRIRFPDEMRSLGPETLRAGDSPWVRFAPAPKDFERCERIEVQDKDGLWRGSAKASTLAGVAPGIVDVVLDSGAALLGKVVDAEGRPIPHARVVLDGVAVSGKTYDRKASTHVDGGFRFDFLPSGSGSITVSKLRYVEKNETVRLVPRAITQQDFILVSPQPAGAIRGRLESETGRCAMEVDVFLRPLSGGASSERAKLSWEEVGGRRIGVFGFEALPAGEYEVKMRARDWFTWNPPERIASPPADGLRFVVHDDIPHAEFAFRPRDADTGASRDAFAWTSLAGDQAGPRWLRSDETFLRRFPLERGFRWRLDRQGYKPAFGDEKAFGVEEMREGTLRKIAEVELQPGWGEVYRVVRRGNRKPISGVKILLDGREAGTTNKDGRCFVSAREKPRSVEIEYREWKLATPVDMRPAWKRKEKRFVEIEAVAASRN